MRDLRMRRLLFKQFMGQHMLSQIFLKIQVSDVLIAIIVLCTRTRSLTQLAPPLPPPTPRISASQRLKTDMLQPIYNFPPLRNSPHP